MIKFKKIIKKTLILISRIIYWIIPSEFKPSKKEYIIYDIFKNEEQTKCYNHFKKYFKTSIFLKSKKHLSRAYGTSIKEYAIEKALQNESNTNINAYLEFGVYKGNSINFFSKYVKKIYGFDSFEGLNEDWAGYIRPKKDFNSNKKIPKLNKNVVLVNGLAQNTLDNFLKENNPKINFVNMDMYTYETSRFILSKIKPYLIDNSVILFNHLYNFPAWDVGEYKALQEIFKKEEYEFKAFSKYEQQVVVQIKK